MIELPTFNGYAVDARVREFRRFDPEKGKVEIVSFDSPQGQCLIQALDFLAFCCWDIEPQEAEEK